MVVVALPPKAQTMQAELPSPNSTHSYWHRDPSKTLLNHHTTPALPATADVLIIGSGISGAFAARTLVAGGRSVVMLEAREACWGATGRNGGHCQPAVWDSVEDVARFELGTFALIRDLVAAHAIPCDWRVVGGVHAIYSADVLAAAERQLRRLAKHPDLADKAVLITDRAELAARRVPGALAAVYQPNAAKLWPYKLVAWVLETLLAEHGAAAAAAFNLQTNTPVTRLERRGGGEEGWVAHTPRGEVAAREVLVAANAYTSYLLPGLADVVVPVRGQVCALEPPAGAVRQLPHSYVWTKDASDQYLVHRGLDDSQVEETEAAAAAAAGTGGDRSLILGGERFATPGGEEGVSRDDAVDPLVGAALRRALAGAVELRPGGEPDEGGDALSAAYEWTGIMGFSRDGSPWVGRVPGSFLGEEAHAGAAGAAAAAAEGLWMSAAFTGHGMPVAPRCGIAVAEMILGKEGVALPAGWAPTEERVAGARLMELPRTLEDVLRALPAGE
ncbi:FAD dependent oxidoreductase [Hypoxylon argillaceum]|nr:FAD dependent oxidoreductase [Hypoxylon argillaceum]